jgi:hypothetical protein
MEYPRHARGAGPVMVGNYALHAALLAQLHEPGQAVPGNGEFKVDVLEFAFDDILKQGRSFCLAPGKGAPLGAGPQGGDCRSGAQSSFELLDVLRREAPYTI